MLMKETLDYEPEAVTIEMLPDGTAWLYLRKNIEKAVATSEEQGVTGYQCDLGVCKLEKDIASKENKETIRSNFDKWWDCASVYSNNATESNGIVEFGSYTGTGTFGKENPNVLVFDSKVSSLSIIKDNEVLLTLTNFKDLDFESDHYSNGNIVYWYCDSAHKQCNEAGKIYTYIKF